jgi:hypothetical protein
VAAGAPDAFYGWGIVNPYAALTSVATPAPSSMPPPAAPSPLAFPAAPAPQDFTGRALAVGGGGILSAGGVAGAAWLARRRKRGVRAA